MKLFIFIFFFLSFFFLKANGQTVLARGDVAFVSIEMNNSTADTFAIVLLKDIDSNTQIGFTDGCYKDIYGYNILSSNHADFYFLWNAPIGGLKAGTIIKFWNSIAAANNRGGAAIASTGTIVEGVGLALNHNVNSDQIFAFQGINSLDTSSTFRLTVSRYLAGIHMNYISGLTNNSNWDGSSSATGLAQSELPDSLVNGIHALRLDSNSFKRENATMNNNLLSLDKAVINNNVNWTVSNTPSNPAVPVTILWNGSTWSGTPSSTVDAIIASSTTPGSFTCKSIRINNEYVLTVDSSMIDTVFGDLFNYGNSTTGIGTLLFGKSGTASLYGNAFEHGGVIEISSSCTLATNSLLNLVASSATSYGQISGSSSGTISGEVTAQFYIGSGGDGWRDICSPLEGVALAQIDDDIPLDFDTLGGSFINIYQFDESGSPPHWHSATSTSQNMDDGAYAIYLLSGNIPVTIDVTGTYYGTSDYTLSGLTYTGNDPDTSGWHIIRNPWPSGLNWDGTVSNVQGNQAYVYDQSNGTYTVYDNITPGVIPPFTAFTIKVNYNNASITLANSKRTTSTRANFFDKTFPSDNYVELKIQSSNNTISDNLIFYTETNASNTFDSHDGVKKMNSPALPSLYFTEGGKKLNKIVYNTIPLGRTTLPLTFESTTHGNYIINSRIDNIDANVKVYLEDLQTNRVYPINGESIAISHTKTENFMLIFEKTDTIATVSGLQPIDSKLNISQDGDRVFIKSNLPVQITITDLLGRILKQMSLQPQNNINNEGQSINIDGLAVGYYIVTVRTNTTSNSQKIFVK